MHTPTLRNTQTNNELNEVINYNFGEGDLTCRVCKRVHKISEFAISYLASYINKLKYWRCYPQGPRPKLNCTNCYNQNTQVFYTCVKCSQQKPLKNYPKAKKFENDSIPCLYCIRVSKGKYANKICYKTPVYEESNGFSTFNASGRIGHQSDVIGDNFIKNPMQSGFERTPVIDIVGLNLSGAESLKVKRFDPENSNSPNIIKSRLLNKQLDSMADSLEICSTSKNSNVRNLPDSNSINQQPNSECDNLTKDHIPKLFGPQALSSTDPLTQQSDSKCSSLTNHHNSIDDSSINLSNSNFINQKLDIATNNLIINTGSKTSRIQTCHNSSPLNQHPDSRSKNQITFSEPKSSSTPSSPSPDSPDQQSNSGRDNFIIVSDESFIHNPPLNCNNTTETQPREQVESEILSQATENHNIAPFNFNIYSLLQLTGRKNSPLPTKYAKPSNLTEDYHDERNSSEMDMEEDCQFLDLSLQPVGLYYSQPIAQGCLFQNPNIESNEGKFTSLNEYNMNSEKNPISLGTNSETANGQLEVFSSNKDTKRSHTNLETDFNAVSDKLEVNGIDDNIKRIRTGIEINSDTFTNQMESANINLGIQKNIFNIEAISTTTGDKARDIIFNNSIRQNHGNIEVNSIAANSQLELSSISEAIKENRINFEANIIPSSKINDIVDISNKVEQTHGEIKDDSTTISDQVKELNTSSNTEINDTNINTNPNIPNDQTEGTITISNTQQNSAGHEANTNVNNQRRLANTEINFTDIINQLEDSGIDKSCQKYNDNCEANSNANDGMFEISSISDINGIQQNFSNDDINSYSSINQIESNKIGNSIVGSCANAEINHSTINNESKDIDNSTDIALNIDQSEANNANSDIQLNSTICNIDPEFEDSTNCSSETKGSFTTSKLADNPQVSSIDQNNQSITQTSSNNPESNPLLIPPLGAQLSNGLQPLITVDECRNKVFSLCQVFENPNISPTVVQSNSITNDFLESRKEILSTNDIITQEKVNLSTESLNSALITPTKLVTNNSTPSNIGNN